MVSISSEVTLFSFVMMFYHLYPCYEILNTHYMTYSTSQKFGVSKKNSFVLKGCMNLINSDSETFNFNATKRFQFQMNVLLNFLLNKES